MIKNKEFKYLLSESPEEAESKISPSNIEAIKKAKKLIEQAYYQDIEVEDDNSVVAWDALREATWEQTSITDDMRRIGTHRLLNEIKTRIELAASRQARPFDSHRFIQDVSNTLHRYVDLGAVRHYNVENFSQTIGASSDYHQIELDVSIVPVMSVERVTMNITLRP
jgi:hypothetical protein